MHAALYPKEPFKGLDHLLRIFAEVPLDQDSVLGSSTRNRLSGITGKAPPGGGKEKNLVWHMANAAGRLDGLTMVSQAHNLLVLVKSRCRSYARRGWSGRRDVVITKRGWDAEQGIQISVAKE